MARSSIVVALVAMLLFACVAQAQEAAQQTADAAASNPNQAADEAASNQAADTVAAADKAIAEASAAPSDVPDLPAVPTPPAGMNGGAADPLNLGSNMPGDSLEMDTANSLPPFNLMNSDATVSPPVEKQTVDGLELGLDRRIRDTEGMLNRMSWQLYRETAWANSVHDIIQNYQYKYTKVLSSIKKNTASIKKMRDLVSELKKVKLHEVLESDLAKATKELSELSSSSSETSEDEGSYAALKDRVALMKQDLEKMSHAKVNKQLHGVISKLKTISEEAVPSDSKDTLKGLMSE